LRVEGKPGVSKNISKKGPQNRRSLHGTPGQVGYARDDKKERVVVRRGSLPTDGAVVRRETL